MSGRSQIALALLEVAPDRELAELMLIAAIDAGADSNQARESWERWEENVGDDRARGELL